MTEFTEERRISSVPADTHKHALMPLKRNLQNYENNLNDYKHATNTKTL